MTETLVQLRSVTKRYGSVVANDGVHFDVRPGEVHAILGENGAGKSTLMSILFGLVRPTSGEIVIGGEPVSLRSPADAIARGLGMVHQHFMLIPTLTVWENVLLAAESMTARERGWRNRVRRLDRRTVKRRLIELAERYRLTVDADAVVGDLSVGEQQRVEILKALYGDARCLILDEPTAVLTPGETRQLFEVIRSLTATGRSVVFISHKLNELIEISDRITVMRRGRMVATADPETVSERELASMMVGRDVNLTVSKTAGDAGDEVVRVADVVFDNKRGVRTLDTCNLSVRRGEIVAVAGVEGNGQNELAQVLAGLLRPTSGSVLYQGADVSHDSPRRRYRRGIGYIPEDRKSIGLVTDFSVNANLVLKSFAAKAYSRFGVVRRDAVRRHAEELVRAYDIRCESVEQACSSLSGGNQQKVVIARECSRELNLLIASQPTRGLDVGAIEYVHERLVAQRDAGAAVVVFSAELDEVLALGDRIAVMYRGSVLATVDRADATRESIGALMAGGR
jgi:simple sugar transport system ATP-binding protein